MIAARPEYAREIRYALTDAFALCERLGLIGKKGTWTRQPRGAIVCCPWHNENTPSCSVRIGPDGTIAVKCFGCQVGGDALSLVAAVQGFSMRSDFKQVLIATAELAGLHSMVAEIEAGEARPARPRIAAPVVAREPDREYPPAHEVADLLAACSPTSEDPDVSAWLISRKLDPDAVDGTEIAFALPRRCALPAWARYQGKSWLETGHRLVVAMRDAKGDVRSVRAGRVVDGDSPKRLPPAGHKAAGLVLASTLAIAMFSGTLKPSRVVFTEGEPDTLVWATKRNERPCALIGIVGGSWTRELAARVPTGAEVILRTDRDEAGNRYAAEISRSIGPRCHIRRSTTT